MKFSEKISGKVSIVSVLYGESWLVKAWIHNVLKSVDYRKVKICVQYRGEDKNIVKVLDYLKRNNVFHNVKYARNNPDVRGSENHKQGLAALISDVDTEYTLIMDCDCVFVGLYDYAYKFFDYAIEKISLTKKENNKDILIGAEQVRRKYVHPSFMIGATSFLKDTSMLYDGDCCEGYSQVAMCEFMPYVAISTDGTDNKALSCYRYGDLPVCVHLLGGTRGKSGFDQYSEKEAKLYRSIYRSAHWCDYRVIIPTFGEHHDNALCEVIQAFRNQFMHSAISQDTMNRLIVVTDNDSHCPEESDFVEFPGVKSKAMLQNLGFWNCPSEYYIFNDRDCVPHGVMMNYIHRSEKPLINHDGVWYGDTLEEQAPGGSITISWEDFLIGGGFDCEMVASGYEDREFIVRIEELTQKRFSRLPLHMRHIEHGRRLVYDDYKEKTKKQYQRDARMAALMRSGSIIKSLDYLHDTNL